MVCVKADFLYLQINESITNTTNKYNADYINQ